MLVPQFSLRMLLALVTACAGISLILSFGAKGRAWAIATAMGVALLALMLVTYAFVFWLVWLFSLAAERRQRHLIARAAKRADRTAIDSVSQ